jgi:hypothetical protein
MGVRVPCPPPAQTDWLNDEGTEVLLGFFGVHIQISTNLSSEKLVNLAVSRDRGGLTRRGIQVD